MYCYEIYKQLSDIYSEHDSSISQNSIYTSLYSGVEKGHLIFRETMLGKRKRVYYKLTEDGEEYYRQLEREYRVINSILAELLKRTKSKDKFVLPTDRLPQGEEIGHIIRIIKGEEEFDGDMDELLRVGLELGSK